MIMDRFAYGLLEGHLVLWQVRHIRWCDVCERREASTRAGLCARCDADARLLVESALMTDPDE
jgi:hypothetical protein